MHDEYIWKSKSSTPYSPITYQKQSCFAAVFDVAVFIVIVFIIVVLIVVAFVVAVFVFFDKSQQKQVTCEAQVPGPLVKESFCVSWSLRLSVEACMPMQVWLQEGKQ